MESVYRTQLIRKLSWQSYGGNFWNFNLEHASPSKHAERGKDSSKKVCRVFHIVCLMSVEEKGWGGVWKPREVWGKEMIID